MKLIRPSYRIVVPNDHYDLGSFIRHSGLKAIEYAARTSYLSEDKITEDIASASKLCKRLKKAGHDSVFEHYSVMVEFIADRGFTHELVRHRLASFVQESTRYCNYSKGKFGEELTFINPSVYGMEDENAVDALLRVYKQAELSYLSMVESGVAPEYARACLPIGVKSKIIITANLREWGTIFKLRASDKAHPLMRVLMKALQGYFSKIWPEIFSNET